MEKRYSLAWARGIAAIVLGLVAMVVYGCATKPGWVGAANKILWDRLGLPIVPVVLAIRGFWFNSAQIQREPVTQKTQKDYEQYVQDQRAQDDATGGIVRGATPREHEVRDDTIYDARNARQALEGSDFRGPEIIPDFLEGYARYFVERDWVEALPALPRSRETAA